MSLDLLWWNRNTGVIQVWFMDGTDRVGFNNVKEQSTQQEHHVTVPWVLVGTGDFNRDGNIDLLWHNHRTGVIQVWFMDGTDRVGVNNVKEQSTQQELHIPITTEWWLRGAGNFRKGS